MSKSKRHPWRLCPLGKHWVTPHMRTRTSSRGHSYTQSVEGHCRSNSSQLDHLYTDEIHEIAARYFSKLKGLPNVTIKEFGTNGNQYDSLIRGWTCYLNEVLSPAEPLDPDIIKALIATESGFRPAEWNHRRGSSAAYGLMQVLGNTVRLLKSSDELRDHLVNLDEDDMLDPNLSICAGIRWLFRKKQILEARAGKKVSWRDAIAAYKGVKPNETKLMPRFDKILKELKGTK